MYKVSLLERKYLFRIFLSATEYLMVGKKINYLSELKHLVAFCYISAYQVLGPVKIVFNVLVTSGRITVKICTASEVPLRFS